MNGLLLVSQVQWFYMIIIRINQLPKYRRKLGKMEIRVENRVNGNEQRILPRSIPLRMKETYHGSG